MVTIGIYYRVSTDRQDLLSQKQAVEKWLSLLPDREKPKTIYQYEDVGISGSKEARPEFQRMLEDAFAKKLDTIVVYRLDRFSRDASSAIQKILQLDTHGVAFVSVSQPALNLGHHVPFRKTMLAAFAEIAEIERDTLIARVNMGLAAARKRGVVLGTPKKCTPELKEKAWVLRSQGLTMREIATRLEVSLGSVSSLLQKT